MNKKELSIATITWARDEQEESLLRKSLHQLAALCIPVFITDGGSPPSFLEFIRSHSHFVLLPERAKGVWEQTRNSVRAADKAGHPYIFYTEPDKLHFFEELLPQMINDVHIDDNTGIVLASRSQSGLASFPPFQQMTENTINACCAEMTGKGLDYSYGPFLFNRQLVPYLQLIKENIGWGWRTYTFGMAHRLGYHIGSYTAGFCCPQDQQADNGAERLHRMRQLSQHVQGLVLSAAVNWQEIDFREPGA